MSRPRRAVLLAAALAATASCGGSDSGTSPSASASSPPAGNGSARAYLDRILDIMQTSSLRRLVIDWPSFRQKVNAVSPNPATIADTYPAIREALGLLEDHHSLYRRADGVVIGNPNPRGSCTDVPAPVPQVPARIGYVKIGAFSGTTEQAQQFALAVEQQIRAADSTQVTGWIVDLRGNGGGNMWPMVAGVGAVLGDGDAGAFVGPTGLTTVWGYANGSSYSGAAAVHTIPNPYRLLRLDPKVAVLTDCYVASSGEATAVSFRGRPNTRTFGTNTYGLSTSNQTINLSDGAQLFLTTAVFADRTGRRYGDVLPPDEVTGGAVQTIQRAIEWLSAPGAVAVDTPRARLLHSSIFWRGVEQPGSSLGS